MEGAPNRLCNPPPKKKKNIVLSQSTHALHDITKPIVGVSVCIHYLYVGYSFA